MKAKKSGQQNALCIAGRPNFHLVLTAPFSAQLQILLGVGATVRVFSTMFVQMVPCAVKSTQFRSASFCLNHIPQKIRVAKMYDQSATVSVLSINKLLILKAINVPV